MTWQVAGKLEDYPPGLHGIRVGTTRLVIARIEDQVNAVDAVCPHKFAAIEEGTIENGCIACPMHDAHFEPTTGMPREGDEWAGQLPTYPTRVIDGRVEVNLD